MIKIERFIRWLLCFCGMGIELKVTEAEALDVLTRFRESIIRASLSAPYLGEKNVSPNLFLNDIIHARLWFREVDSVRRHVEKYLGKDEYARINSLFEQCNSAARGLWQAFTDERPVLGSFIHDYFNHLRGIPVIWDRVAGISPEGLERDDLQRFERAVVCLAMPVVVANQMYRAESVIEFLKHVKSGNLDTDYGNSLAKAETCFPKTL